MEKKKLFVVSDIHGHYTLLKEALENAGFRKNDKEHLLICCGDCFDRGKENLQVLKFLDLIDNKILIRGNHEDMLLEILENSCLKQHNFINGTVQTIEDFFGKYVLDYGSFKLDFSGKTRMLDRVTGFIGEMVDYYETEHYVFVHGWVPIKYVGSNCVIDANWRQASTGIWKKARWYRWDEMIAKCDRVPGKTIVCGHMPVYNTTTDGENIFYSDGLIAIDAGTCSSGKINVLVLEETYKY